MTMVEDGERIQDFLSFGMTEVEARRIWDTPDGMRIFEYLGSLSEPLRIPDLLGHLKALGLPEFLPPESVENALSFLPAPVLHHGERVGHIFVADRVEGEEFLPEDEETLLMFAPYDQLGIEAWCGSGHGSLSPVEEIPPTVSCMPDGSLVYPIWRKSTQRIPVGALTPGSSTR